MLLRGRHSLNFDSFPVVHWVLIPVLVNIFKRFHHIGANSTRKGSTYLPPYSLFEFPVLPLQNMCSLAPPFCNSPMSASIWNMLAINIQMKRLHATSKNLPQSLTGCYSISDGLDESNTKGGLVERPPLGCHLRVHLPNLERWRGGGGDSLRGWRPWGDHQDSPLILVLAKMVVKAGPSKTSMEVGCIRPTVGVRPPQTVFKGGPKWPQRYHTSWGQWLSVRCASTKRVPSSSISNPSHAWFMR